MLWMGFGAGLDGLRFCLVRLKGDFGQLVSLCNV